MLTERFPTESYTKFVLCFVNVIKIKDKVVVMFYGKRTLSVIMMTL